VVEGVARLKGSPAELSCEGFLQLVQNKIRPGSTLAEHLSSSDGASDKPLVEEKWKGQRGPLKQWFERLFRE
jgi:hypothetical protein